MEEHTTVKCWRWVPTKLNVADDATRDPPTHFDETHRWFHGPDFLRKSEDEWPQETVESEQPTGRRDHETTHLREGKAVTRRSRLRKFAMEIDENGVLRLKGRIKAAKDVSFTLNRPAVLSGDSSIAKLIMKHYHERLHDTGFASIHRSKRNSESDVFGQRHEFRRRKQRTDEHTRGTREMKKEADVRTITEVHTSRRSEHGWRLGALVRSIKTALAATLRGALAKKFSTPAAEAEHIVNSRPLTEVDVEPAEAEGLTPNHFLIGRSCGAAAAVPCKLARVSAPRRSLLAEVVENTTDSGAPPGARRPYMPRAGRGRHRADRRLIITSILVASRQN
ncbi:hypothetical protein EVAR_89130_1 [Eumeta japonica]|uniref:Uncharacterized protein n=1 Tax=Eumeta variegata TaxID=151549 RepID=A0A4C1ZQ01_EUMVA|nr:hypothetical protein EVAR_89130_1 [Eumeta japonica]